MRFTTTILLAALVAGGIVAWQYDRAHKTTETLEPNALAELAINQLDIVAIELGPDIKLERRDGVWNLPGGWPARQSEAHAITRTLSELSSRFAPVFIDDAKSLGLDSTQHPAIVKITLRSSKGAEMTHTLAFGEPPTGDANPFVRPTYLRIDQQSSALRLAPGTLESLKKSRDDFLRKQLFPDVIRAKVAGVASLDGDLPPAAQPLIDAREIAVTGPDGAWTLKHQGELTKSTAPIQIAPEKLAGQWELTAPVVDRVDPERLRAVLAAVPEMWVEQFVAEVDPAKTGLDKPERTLNVKTPERELKVLIGKVSRVKETRPPAPPPQANPFSPPPPPPQVTREEFRYAKLPNNPQVFEVRADRFAELFAKPGDLRDARIARFRSADAKRLEIALINQKLVFAKEKDAGGEERWRLLEPVAAPAEAVKITELLDKLSELQAKDADVIDSTELKTYGLADGDKFISVTVSLVDETPGAKPRQLIYRIGKQDPIKSKLCLQLVGNARIDVVNDDLLKLVDRPVLAYRSRRVIDAPTKDIAAITVDRAADGYSLTQTDGKWSLTAPVSANADPGKSSALANDLAKLEATEYVNFAPSPDDLKKYGLDSPATKAAIAFADAKQPARQILIGHAREGKPEAYAKLADSPEVFAIRQELKDTIAQASLAYRPLLLWQAAGPSVAQITLERPGASFTLSRDEGFWKIAGPFAATAFLPSVQPILEFAAAPRVERFETHGGDLAKFGLDKPSLTLRATLRGAAPDSPITEKIIQLGKQVVEGQPARYAKVADQPGIFVVAGAQCDAIEKPALDLLDRKLLSVDARAIVKLEGVGPGGPWSAKRDGERWQIDSLTPPAVGDRSALEILANMWNDIRATRFAAYGAADLAKFGLDKPATTVTCVVSAGDKDVKHTVALGSAVEGNPSSRYARIDGGPAVAILSPSVANEFGRSGLDFVDRGVLSFDPRELIAIRRKAGNDEFVIEKKDASWQIVKPFTAAADEPVINEMTERFANLRALRVAAVAAKDLKPFGLDAPAAVFTLVLKEKDGRLRELALKIGAASPPDGRFAQTGSETVFVLPDADADPLVSRLLAGPVKFRDRSLLHFTDADRVTIARAGRTATFAKVEGRWKMTAPVSAEAEAFDLDDLILASSKLRAEDLLAEKTDDLKQYGLDKPETELQFFLGDKEVAKLLVAKRDGEGRAVAKSAAGDAVGRLEPAIANRVLAEFRKRALWANLDAAQVDTLIVNPGTGPLVLNKTETGWQVAGKPELQVKNEAVSELLAALAGLRAERFVADQKADDKLYGLEKPVRTIVARSRTGQTTTLNLGRFEGESKHAYAAIPEKPGEVVVLSESDSNKLLKPIADFTHK